METVDKVNMSLDDIIDLHKRQKKLPNKVKQFNARIGNKKVARTSTVQKTKTQQRRKPVSSQQFRQPAQIKQKHEHLKKLKQSKQMQQQKLRAVRQEKLSNKKRQKQARQNLLSQKRKLPQTTPSAGRSRKQLQPNSGGYKAGMIADSVQQKKRRWGNNNADSGIMTISVSNTKSYNDPVVLIGRKRGKKRRPVHDNESQSTRSFSGPNQQGRGMGRLQRRSPLLQQIKEMKPASKQEFSFEKIQLENINFTTGKSLNDRFSQNVSVKRRGGSTVRGQGGHSSRGRGGRTVFL